MPDVPVKACQPATSWCIVLIQAVVEEFSPSTASPLGLPWEQHDRCRKSLQQEYLQTFYQHAASKAAETAPSACQGQDGGVCCACLSLMAAVLAWDFRSHTFFISQSLEASKPWFTQQSPQSHRTTV